MDIWKIISLVVLCLLLIEGLRVISMKQQIRKIRSSLARSREMDYNRQITIALIDREIEELAAEINRNLDYQKSLKLTAEQSEQQIRQSISDIAHDLRTPLTVIKGNLQRLEQEKDLTQEEERYLQISMQKADALKEMVDNFFELSVLESDHSPAVTSQINLTALLMNFLAEHESIIRQHHLTPEIRLPEVTVYVQADEQMLERILSNLLSNVVKYAKDAFRIELVVEDYPDVDPELGGEHYGGIRISNRLAEDSDVDADRLFERTYRGSRERTGTGAGLGLYIVRLLTEKQGGYVSAGIEQGDLFMKVMVPKRKKAEQS